MKKHKLIVFNTETGDNKIVEMYYATEVDAEIENINNYWINKIKIAADKINLSNEQLKSALEDKKNDE